MMQEQETWALQTRSILKECFEQMRFARAAELARSRRYLEAEGLLSPNGRLPSEPRELDLLARIAARQKHFDQARRLWEAALLFSPDNKEYQQAIRLTETKQRTRHFRRMVLLIGLASVVTAALCLSVLHFSPSHSLVPKQPVKSTQPATKPPLKPQPKPVQPQPLPPKR